MLSELIEPIPIILLATAIVFLPLLSTEAPRRIWRDAIDMKAERLGKRVERESSEVKVNDCKTRRR